MTEQPPPAQQPITIDAKVITAVADYYKRLSWLIPIAERLGGFKIPREILQALDSLASGKPITAEDMAKLEQATQSIAPAVGEPVMTRGLAQTAWFLHYKEGMGTREIAEQFTKDGNPCSHATVARWINAIDEEKRFGKIARLIGIGKILGYCGIVALAFFIGHWLW